MKNLGPSRNLSEVTKTVLPSKNATNQRIAGKWWGSLGRTRVRTSSTRLDGQSGVFSLRQGPCRRLLASSSCLLSLMLLLLVLVVLLSAGRLGRRMRDLLKVFGVLLEVDPVLGRRGRGLVLQLGPRGPLDVAAGASTATCGRVERGVEGGHLVGWSPVPPDAAVEQGISIRGPTSHRRTCLGVEQVLVQLLPLLPEQGFALLLEAALGRLLVSGRGAPAALERR